MRLTARGMLLGPLPTSRSSSRSAVVVNRLLHRVEEVAQHVAQAGGGADVKQALGVCTQTSEVLGFARRQMRFQGFLAAR